ncbi:MAG: hypothetical protein COB76_00655 [Alphaproteobacteria bacterium]|nr:MAG: hypothetical protein COB76_00655 [Alphaproteobacteria bacterium]
MKILFCHDHHYYTDESDTLSKGQYHNSIWQRYLDHFDDVTVLGRDGGTHTGTRTGMNTASRPHVSFTLFSDMNTLKGLLSGRKEIKKSIKKIVRTHDVILIRGVSEIGMLTFKEARRQNKIIAMENVGCSWDDMWNHGSIKAKIYAPYRFWMGKHLSKHADAVIYVSQEFLQGRYPSNASLQAAASNVQIESTSFRDTYNVNADTPLKIGLIGTLKNKLKGVHIALEAFKILKSRGVDGFTFHLLGPGDANAAPIHFNQSVKNLGLEKIAFHDGLRESGTPVHEWLRDLDLYIQPSFQEGVPRATIEALAQSLPAIGARAGGIPELLDPTCIVKPGDAKGLADKIEWMIKNPDIRAHHAKRNHDVATRYTMEKLIPIRKNFWKTVKSMAEQKQPK